MPMYQLETQERDDQLARIVLRTGYVDGTTTADIELPIDIHPVAQRVGFVSGPGGGLVSFSIDDGTTSEIRIVEIESGAVTTVHETSDRIVDGVIDRAGTMLIILTADRRAGALRLRTLTLAGPMATRKLTDVPWTGAAGGGRNQRIRLHEASGDEVVVERCIDTACTYELVSTMNGSVVLRAPAGTGEIVGLANGLLLAHPSSWGMTKRFSLVELRTGAVVKLPNEGQRATLVESPAGPIVVIEEGAPDEVTLVAYRRDGSARREFELRDERFSHQLVQQPERQGLRPPSGWFVLGDEGRISIDGPTDAHPILVNVATGERVALRNLGPRQ